MLYGQLADAFITPLVGIASDNFNSRFGKRTPFYILGVVVLLSGFYFTYTECPFTTTAEEESYRVVLYYSIFGSLFNIGFAIVQISYQSLLPSLSINRKSKDSMVRIRTEFKFKCQLLSMIFSSICFYFITNNFLSFKVLTIFCITIGLICSFIYLYWCRELELTKNIEKHYNDFTKKLISQGKYFSVRLSPNKFGICY